MRQPPGPSPAFRRDVHAAGVASLKVPYAKADNPRKGARGPMSIEVAEPGKAGRSARQVGERTLEPSPGAFPAGGRPGRVGRRSVIRSLP